MTCVELIQLTRRWPTDVGTIWSSEMLDTFCGQRCHQISVKWYWRGEFIVNLSPPHVDFQLAEHSKRSRDVSPPHEKLCRHHYYHQFNAAVISLPSTPPSCLHNEKLRPPKQTSSDTCHVLIILLITLIRTAFSYSSSNVSETMIYVLEIEDEFEFPGQQMSHLTDRTA